MPDAPPDILTRRGPRPDAVLRYREGVDGVIDVYRPPGRGSAAERSGGDAPHLVVLLHGGFWRARYDRAHLRPLAAECAARGAVVALPEFRRVGGGGEWPVIGLDVEAALAHIVRELRPSRPYTLVGHSAGGHLALWAGLRAGLPGAEPPAEPAPVPTAGSLPVPTTGPLPVPPAELGPVRRIVALAPVSDLYAAASRALGDGAVADLLGGAPRDRAAAYRDADPLRYLPARVPLMIVQGADDADVPAELNRSVAARHPDIAYTELPGVEHLALIDPLSAVCRSVVLPALLDR